MVHSICVKRPRDIVMPIHVNKIWNLDFGTHIITTRDSLGKTKIVGQRAVQRE